MPETPERKVKKKVVNVLDEFGAYYFYPVTGGYGRSGVPDIICCFKGKFIAIECKAGEGKTTALQDKNLDAIRAQNGRALVVNEENISDVVQLLIDIQNGL